MPEIAEVSRIVSFLRKHLINRRIASVLTQDDPIVYGKVGTSGDAVAKALKGKTVLDARQQGKYFWLVMDTQPHLLMHFGMSGWMKFSNEETFYYSDNRKSKKAEDVKSDEEEAEATSKKGSKGKSKTKTKTADDGDANADENETPEWPPKYWKFLLKLEGSPPCEAAFVDSRRLARIRLIDAPADSMRNTTPLKENGPDPVIDKDILTADWLLEKTRKKKVPIKAFLLDQANISGVGNWVGDEVLYNARIHPEQYSNTLSDEQVKQLHTSLMYVCDLACGVLADSNQFPEDWLFKHRWNKGKKGEDANVLPNGEKIIHVTVGGRTSAIVPSVQKKTGVVAGDADDNDDTQTTKVKKPAKKGKRKARSEESELDEEEDEEEHVEQKSSTKKAKKATTTKKAKRKIKNEESELGEDGEEDEQVEDKPAAKRKSKKTTPVKGNATNGIAEDEVKTPEATPKRGKVEAVVKEENDAEESKGRRRSARMSKS